MYSTSFDTAKAEPPRSAATGATMQTIDICPSWRAILPILVEIAANSKSLEGRDAAMQELLRLADTVDQMNESLRKESPCKPF